MSKQKSKEKLAFLQKKNNAKQRGIEFLLTYDEFKKIKSQKTCYYTGIMFSENGDSQFTIDRIDCNVGYTVENSVACCLAVNRFKNTYFERTNISEHPFFIAIKKKLELHKPKESKFKQILKILLQ